MEVSIDIKSRRALCEAAISMLEKSDDPRAESALEHYRTQLAEINRRIEQEKTPPDVVVSLQPAKLFAREG